MIFVRKLFLILIVISFPVLTNAQSYFTLGSTFNEVRQVQGTPDDITHYSASGYERWEYGRSSIKISTSNGKVIEWDNKGNLRVRLFPGSRTTNNNYFSQGSHRDDVIRLQGTPDEISRYSASGYERWEYGRSSVKISTRIDKVLEWDNKGNLKIAMYPGNQATNSRSFSQGSHKDDVLQLQGTPDEISRYTASGYERWEYDRSSVKISIRSDKVLEWDNKGNLKIGMQPGSQTTGKRTFSQGSHKDEVLELQGSPDEISRYSASGYERWEYGRSSVKISTYSNKVLEWDNKGNLKVEMSAGSQATGKQKFSQGSHKDEVLALQGTPDEISRYTASGYERWEYGRSSVKISTHNQKVLEWDNKGNLKVAMRPGNQVTSSNSFNYGSHKDDVLRLQGTPDDINRYSAMGYERWDYGRSSVKISMLNNTVTEYSNKGNLKAPQNEVSDYERKVQYHHTFDDLTLYYDENKSFSNIFSFELDSDEKVYGVVKEGVTYFYDEEFSPLNMYAYYDKDKDLQVESVSNETTHYSTNKVRNGITNIDFSGDVSGTGTATRHGNMTFYDVMTDNGSYIHGSSIDIGRMSFDDFYTSEGVSYSGSRMRIGRFSFGDWSSFDGPDVSGTSTKIGNMIFHDYTTSDGRTVSGTTMQIGDFSFTDFNEY
jgi:hypothetical protein